MTDIAETTSCTTLVVIDSKAGKKQLAKLEKRIEANTKAAWRENGLIMLHIRNAGLYKAGYGTFESYLEKRWDLSVRHGQRMIAGVEFVQKLAYYTEIDSEKCDQLVALKPTTLPANEGQIRPLQDSR